MQTGLDIFMEKEYRRFSGARLGLITNPSAVDRNLNSIIDLFHEHPALELKKLFGPEHGVRGNMQAGEKITDAVDGKTGLPVISLYGSTKHLTAEMIKELDLIVFDLQDIGARFYTVIYTLAYALSGIKEAGKKLLVLDRPNPIAPLGPAGNIIDEDYSSFVGGYRLPVRHGMTIGELALYFNQEFEIEADLEIIRMEGWDHQTWFEQTELPWVYPSPNIPTVDTAILYPGTCFFEGTNLSEGRGTTKPFELIGAPWISAADWADELNSYGLTGVAFRPVYFSPTFSKHQGEQVEGVQVHIINRLEVEPLEIGLTMLASVFKNHQQCDWVKFKDHYFIDWLAGGNELRQLINSGADYQQISRNWQEPLNQFSKIRNRYLLYPRTN